MLFGQIAFMLTLQIRAPLYRVLKRFPGLDQNFHRFSVRQPHKLGGNNFLQRLKQGLIDPLIEECHVLFAILQHVAEDPFQKPLGQVHIVR